ncbi:hypothetical protein G6F32_012934 [Rhizopus arrhizus]|nr:hypothetical protein G6F32_012934 [Rhizopus arrhizus]
MPALRTACLLFALAAVASGCASTTPKYLRAPSLAAPEPAPQDSRNAYLELIARMQQQGAWYASLAHVDAFRQRYGDRPALRLLQADALRETGQADAAIALYRELSTGPQAAAAAHGLGLIAAHRADAAGSEHPGPSSPAQGAAYTARVLDALTADPEVWSRTALLLMFDENDGFFDHMPTPSAPSRNDDGSLAGKSTLTDAEMAFEYFTYPPATPKQQTAAGQPFGPGMRVPMWVISPWSRGGWVNSQVFDHTSALRFLEQRFGVVEPNISAFRRAVCGDLTSTLNFGAPNSAALPTLPGRTTKTDADGLTTWQEAQPAIAVPTQQTLAKQAPGTRPSRALPYELHTSAREDARENRVRLLFANASSSQAAAVFHVRASRWTMPGTSRATAASTTCGCWGRTAITAPSRAT